MGILTIHTSYILGKHSDVNDAFHVVHDILDGGETPHQNPEVRSQTIT